MNPVTIPYRSHSAWLSQMLSGHPTALKMPPAPDVGNGPRRWVGVATNSAFAGPWDVTYAANLKPDKATGLGSWKTADFANAMCTEKPWV